MGRTRVEHAPVENAAVRIAYALHIHGIEPLARLVLEGPLALVIGRGFDRHEEAIDRRDATPDLPVRATLEANQREGERAGLLQTGVQDAADRSVRRAVRRGTREELEWRAATHRPLERPVDVLLHVAEPLRVVVLGIHGVAGERESGARECAGRCE